MNRIKPYWKTILIVLNAIAIILVSIQFWFWAKLELIFSSEVFNNILTPIATAATGLLMYFALRESARQNKIASSQIVKRNLEQEFEFLKGRLMTTEYTFKYPAPFVGHPDKPKVSNGITIFAFFKEIESYLQQCDLYQGDKQWFLTDILHDVNHYTYSKDLLYAAYVKFLNPFAINGIASHQNIVDFIEKIESSKLLSEDLNHFKLRIRDEILHEYMQFIAMFTNTDQQFLIPMCYQPNKEGKVGFEPFAFSKIGEHYLYFKEKLSNIP